MIQTMKKTLLALVAILCFTFAASAADISGKWMRDPAAAPAGGGGGRGGGGMQTWEFKVSGTTITGSRTQPGRGGGPDTVITVDEGKMAGDTFTFSIMQPGRGGGDPTKVVYTGKVVASDKLEISADTGRGPTVTPLVPFKAAP
jgi:opacity protein-like surface antigen